MEGIKSIENVALLVEITGLVGALDAWLQYFQKDGYRPGVVHGCTSITIPEARIYFASKQLLGLLEGLPGAAWYEQLLDERYPNRGPGSALTSNTGLGFAQLLVFAFIILGNLGYFFARRSGREE